MYAMITLRKIESYYYYYSNNNINMETSQFIIRVIYEHVNMGI